ncbi:hypothetical protein C8J57DRAFT_1466167 [Mycena rebaudengoi]|nr:hypothetical protein C8J57DRAFT_1466167 [Mycena rebaudengoi]
MPPLPVITFVFGGWASKAWFLSTEMLTVVLQVGFSLPEAVCFWLVHCDNLQERTCNACLSLLLHKFANPWFCSALVWIQNVEYFMDLEKAANMFFTNWLNQSAVIIGAIMEFSVQAFFCRRFWNIQIISSNIYLVAFVVLLFVFGLIAAIALQTTFEFSGQLFLVSQTVIMSKLSGQLTTADSFEITDKEIWGSIYYAMVVAGDAILSGSTIYFLLKRLQQALPETVGILNRFIWLVFQSAMPVTLCALVNFIYQALGIHSTSIDTTQLFLQLTAMMLPKLYAISAMWTLNARRELSAQFNADIDSSSEKKPRLFTSRQMVTTMQFRRHSVDGGQTFRIVTPEEMMDIPEHTFGRRIDSEPYPDDINRRQATHRVQLGQSISFLSSTDGLTVLD